jgi:hypothetical protein
VGSLDAGEGKLISSELKGNVFFASGHLLYVRARTLMAQPFDTKRMEPTGSAIPLTEQELEQRTSFLIFGFSVSPTKEARKLLILQERRIPFFVLLLTRPGSSGLRPGRSGPHPSLSITA